MRSTRRILVLLSILVVYLMAVSVAYQRGMTQLEGKPRTFLDGVQWAADTFSTTGYGRDTHWKHPVMIALVILVQFSGMVVVPLVIALFVLPFLNERFEQRLPREAPQNLSGHVIVYRFGPAVEALLQRLADNSIPALVAESDEERARNVLERGEQIVFSRSDDEILDVCRLSTARALVANGRDEENAGVILRARQMGFQKEIYAFVENPTHRKPIELAGATSAYTPRHIVAAALAAHASDALSPRLPGIESLPSIQRREIRILPASPLAGMTLAASEIGAKTGAVVVGLWKGSHLISQCDGSRILEAGCALEIVGDQNANDRAAELIGSPLLRNSGPFLVAGFGEVGRKVHELLCDAGEEVRVIERHPAPGVDVAGDVLDPSVMLRAGIREARGVLLALDNDDATLFAAVIARDAAPDVSIFARVNHARNVSNIDRAGADFALSISDISGEVLSSRLLGRSARPRDEHRRVVRLPATRWAGRTVAELPLRRNYCSVIAIDRGGVIKFPARPDMRIDEGDGLWVCGTVEALHRV